MSVNNVGNIGVTNITPVTDNKTIKKDVDIKSEIIVNTTEKKDEIKKSDTKSGNVPANGVNLSDKSENEGLFKQHSLYKGLLQAGLPIAYGYVSLDLTERMLVKTTEKNVEKALIRAMNKPTIIKVTLDDAKVVKSFPPLMGKGSTTMSNMFYSKPLKEAFEKSVKNSVSWTMDQAVGAGTFMGTANVIEKMAPSAEKGLVGNPSQYGAMLTEPLRNPTAGKPLLQTSKGNFKASVSFSGDVNSIMFQGKGTHVEALAQGAKDASFKIRRGPNEKLLKQTIVSPDAIVNVSKSTERALLKSSNSKVGKINKALNSSQVTAVAGYTFQGALMAWDAYDAVKKTQNENISTASKALAWATVGLDAATIAGYALTKGGLGAYTAIGSIGTSILSDVLK